MAIYTKDTSNECPDTSFSFIDHYSDVLFCEAEYPVACYVGSKMLPNLAQRGKFRNAPSACSEDRNFQGFASLLKYQSLIVGELFRRFIFRLEVYSKPFGSLANYALHFNHMFIYYLLPLLLFIPFQ